MKPEMVGILRHSENLYGDSSASWSGIRASAPQWIPSSYRQSRIDTKINNLPDHCASGEGRIQSCDRFS